MSRATRLMLLAKLIPSQKIEMPHKPKASFISASASASFHSVRSYLKRSMSRRQTDSISLVFAMRCIHAMRTLSMPMEGTIIAIAGTAGIWHLAELRLRFENRMSNEQLRILAQLELFKLKGTIPIAV